MDWFNVNQRLNDLRTLGMPMDQKTLELVLLSAKDEPSQQCRPEFSIEIDPYTNKPSAQGLLHLRLSLMYPTSPWPMFKNIHAVLTDTKAFVFVVRDDDQAVIIEDDATLFPSDALMTQLKLLKGK